MVVGDFILLCGIAPDEIYRWFMELFVDACDWVMVPNVYGLSQYSDGGLMTTMPYCSSSHYTKKMSDYLEGEWCAIWDALFWSFIGRYREFFSKNPRLRVMVNQPKKWGKELCMIIRVLQRSSLNAYGAMDRVDTVVRTHFISDASIAAYRVC